MGDMADRYDEASLKYAKEAEQPSNQYRQAEPETSTESNMIYQLNQQREYHIRKLMDIQNAIDSVRAIR